MRASARGADMSAYLEAAAESRRLLADAETEELAAVYSRERYRMGEIDAGRFRDEVGEASIRADRARRELAAAGGRWSGLVAETGAFPSVLAVALERNVHRIASICSRLEALERDASEEADRQAEMETEDQAREGAPDPCSPRPSDVVPGAGR